MEDSKNNPVLVSCFNLSSEFAALRKIQINSHKFSIGRASKNSLIIPCLSRYHCIFARNDAGSWIVVDKGTHGIKVNGILVGKDKSYTLHERDVLTLDKADKLVYKFCFTNKDVFDKGIVGTSVTANAKGEASISPYRNSDNVPDLKHEVKRQAKKRASSDHDVCERTSKHARVKPTDIPINNNKNNKDNKTNVVPISDDASSNGNDTDHQNNMTFEECMLYIEQTAYKEHRKGNNKHKKQKQETSSTRTTSLPKDDMNPKVEERHYELMSVMASFIDETIERKKVEALDEKDAQLSCMKAQMLKVMSELHECNEREQCLLNENNVLKEKMEREKQDFKLVLTLKQDTIDKLEALIREQSESNRRDHQTSLLTILEETDKVRRAKENEIKEIIERKMELEYQLGSLNAARELERLLQKECEKIEVEKQVKDRIEAIEAERMNEINTLKESLNREKEASSEVQARLVLHQKQARKQIDKLERELDKSEQEKQQVVEDQHEVARASRECALQEVGRVLDAELQCSICVDVLVSPVILNCSHTFCEYCLTVHTTRSDNCPLCRVQITSCCKNLVLDTLVDKLTASLSDDMKQKRRELLDYRQAEVVDFDYNDRTSSPQYSHVRNLLLALRPTNRRPTLPSSNGGLLIWNLN